MKNSVSLVLAALSFAFVVPTPVSAQINTWGGGNESWFTAANWSLNEVPTSDHDVRIENGTTPFIPSGTAFSGQCFVGHTGTGGLRIDSGATLQTGLATIGWVSGSNGTVDILGGTLTLVGLFAGGSGTAVLTVRDGGVINTALWELNLAFGGGSQGTLNIGASAGSAAAPPGFLNVTNVAGGEGDATLVFNHTGTNYFFTTNGSSTGTPVVIDGSTRLLHAGGTTVLAGPNPYTGGTTVSGGTLRVNGSVNSAFSVEGGTLGGTGQVGAITLTAGALAPGNSAGTLTASGLEWNGGTLVFELGADTASSDRLILSGDLAGNGPFHFTFEDLGWQPDVTYDLISFGSTPLTAEQFTFTGPAGPAGRGGTFTIDGNTLRFTTFPDATELPEGVQVTFDAAQGDNGALVISGMGQLANVRFILEYSDDLQTWIANAIHANTEGNILEELAVPEGWTRLFARIRLP